MATLFKSDNFDHESLLTYDSTVGTPGFVSTPVRSGAAALAITAAAAAESVTYNIASQAIVAMSFYIYIPTALPTADVMICRFLAAASQGFILLLNTGDQFCVRLGGVNVAGGPTVVPDTWYRIDVEADYTNNPSILAARVDGGTEFSRSAAIGPNVITEAMLGTANADTVTAYYEDWGISITDGDYPIGDWNATGKTNIIVVGV